ncbi:MAG: hypothetical protein HFH82_14890 [Lachnospiraceae bacterium]|nr:hypothetical protein [Lachnospiraceae bacterium]
MDKKMAKKDGKRYRTGTLQWGYSVDNIPNCYASIMLESQEGYDWGKNVRF